MRTSRIGRIIIAILLLLGTAYFFSRPSPFFSGGQPRRLAYSAFVEAIDSNNVSSGIFDKHYFRGRFTQAGGAFTVYLPPENTQEYTLLVEKLQAHHVRYEFREPVISDNIVAMVISVVLPLGVIFVFWMFFLRQAQRNGSPRP